jgi:hypothetical protein
MAVTAFLPAQLAVFQAAEDLPAEPAVQQPKLRKLKDCPTT